MAERNKSNKNIYLIRSLQIGDFAPASPTPTTAADTAVSLTIGARATILGGYVGSMAVFGATRFSLVDEKTIFKRVALLLEFA